MLKNYFKIAWRNLRKNKFYSFISIFGLALGMSCSLLIALWVQDEMSFNRFFKDYKDIYFVRYNGTRNGDIYTSSATPGPLAKVIKENVPTVAYSVKLGWNRSSLLSTEEGSNKEDGIYATEDLFNVFPLPALQGAPQKAIADPAQIIISRKIAENYFGTTAAVGKTIRLDNSKTYIVGAVIENIPANSSVRFDWVVNFKETEEDWMKTWGNTSFRTFVRLMPDTKKATAEAGMKDIFRNNTDAKDKYPILQPLKDVYLYTDFQGGLPAGGRIAYIRIFLTVAAFILLIACINFMNLATARSSQRSKEIGIRKVVGAGRVALFRQFMGESLLTSFLALLLAFVMVLVMLPEFNNIFNKQIQLRFADPVIVSSMIGLLFLTAVLAGCYPALFLSALKPVRILKNNLRSGLSAAFLRKTLVIVQFTISVFLIIGIVVISRQMKYAREKNLGLDRERLVYIPIEGEIEKKLETFRQEVLQSPFVSAATTTAQLPVNLQSTSSDLSWKGKDPALQTDVTAMHVGYDFVKTMNIKMVEGRDFSKEFISDTTAYLINESLAKLMGMEHATGQQISFWNGNAPVIGVMKDFHYQSLHSPIQPLILCLYPPNTSHLMVKLRAGKIQAGIHDLEKLATRFNPAYPFTYHFVDEEYESLYRSDVMTAAIMKYFGILAVLISCLGLLGLTTFTAEQRTKEIGIRKVLGASVTNVVGLLSRDFIKLVLIAIVIASPLAWYIMNRWLADFAYKISIDWRIFAFSGSLAILIAVITISFQSVKAGFANPVKSLRTE